MVPNPIRAGLAAGALLLTAAIALTGCTPAAAPVATASVPPSSIASATPTPVPTIDLTGNASENLPYFDKVNNALIAKGGSLGGRDFIDNLVAAGYPKEAMEVTPDKTTVNLDADNIEFSVRLGSTCLVGEYGNIGYASTSQRVFSTGKCLAGTTRKIDW